MQKKKNILIALLLSISSLFLFAGCFSTEEEVSYDPVGLDGIQSDTYYVKVGHDSNAVFYPLIAGETSFDPTVSADEATEGRIVSFLNSADNIPTMYQDDSLILKTSSIPESFTLERYLDCGYSVGAFNLAGDDTNKVHFDFTTYYLNQYSDLVQQILNDKTLKEQSNFLFDRVGDITVYADNLTEGLSVGNLQSGQVYSVDLYLGTDCYTLSAQADTHIFSSFEWYTANTYDMNASGYLEINLPESCRSGYYYVDGVGMFRYVDGLREDGAADIDFTIPCGEEEDEEEDVDRDAVGTIYMETEIDTSCSYFTYEISYLEDDYTFYNAFPSAILVDPIGMEYEFTSMGNNLLSCELEMPISGKYQVIILGMDGRTFTCSDKIETGKADYLIHEGSGTGELSFYNPDNLNDGAVITVTWSNQSSGAEIEIVGSDELDSAYDYTADSVYVTDTKEAYGSYVMEVVKMPQGQYTLQITGNDLGEVRISIEGVEAEEETEAEIEIIEKEESKDDELSSEEAETKAESKEADEEDDSEDKKDSEDTKETTKASDSKDSDSKK